MSNEKSDAHFVFKTFLRDRFIRELVPQTPLAHVVIRKPDGREISRELAWKESAGHPRGETIAPASVLARVQGSYMVDVPEEILGAMRGSITEHGSATPFFLTDAAKQRFSIGRVNADGEFLKRYGVPLDKVPDIYAGLYRYSGKTILLVRQPTYLVSDPKERIGTFKALLDQYDEVADVLVLDQTHNPGGSTDFLENFFKIFAKPESRYLVQSFNADRKWIESFHQITAELEKAKKPQMARIFSTFGGQVETAYDRGDELTGFLPFFSVTASLKVFYNLPVTTRPS